MRLRFFGGCGRIRERLSTGIRIFGNVVFDNPQQLVVETLFGGLAEMDMHSVGCLPYLFCEDGAWGCGCGGLILHRHYSFRVLDFWDKKQPQVLRLVCKESLHFQNTGIVFGGQYEYFSRNF